MVLVMDDEPEGPVMPIVHALGRGDALVPPLWDYEVTSALMIARRTGRLDDHELEQSLYAMSTLGCVRDAHPVRITHLLDTATEHGLTAYDAAYLSLAMRRALPLATADRALARAAERAGVTLIC